MRSLITTIVAPEFLLAVIRHVVNEFQVTLDELHNDSTTVSFYGAYSDACEEGVRLGRATPAITWGHSKAKRPDLKSLPLYPEGRPCTRPTAHRVIEIFEPIQRHVLTATRSDATELEDDAQVMVTELTPVQRQIVELLGLSPETYGR